MYALATTAGTSQLVTSYLIPFSPSPDCIVPSVELIWTESRRDEIIQSHSL